ncbi:MAG TPA: glycosyltransferase family 39 protein, partial [Gemmataceae bacterium]|nr:glycosyltransferase family 39 protein [Gemmataceae bacterium]
MGLQPRTTDERDGRTPAAPWKRLLLIFLLALAVRSAFVVWHPWGTPDSAGYDTIARNLMEGHGFSFSQAPPYRPTLYRTPVYPYFLVAVYSVFGFSHLPVHVIQAAIGSLTCCLIYLICRRYWDERTALLAALLNAVFPFQALFTAVVLTETVYAFLVCCTVYLLTRAYQGRSLGWTAAAGFALGLTILCRPEACLLPPFLALILLCCFRLRRPAWEMSALLALCSGLVVFPWLVRNYHTSGRVMSLVNSGPGVAFWQCTLPYFSMDTFQFEPGAEDRDPMVKAYLGAHTDEECARMEPVFWRAGWQNVRSHPLTYLRLRLRDYPHLWIS